MARFLWLIRRLKAMSIPEVLWRLSQKKIQKQEEKQFSTNKIPVTKTVFNEKLSKLKPHPGNLHINFNNQNYGLNTSIHLLAGADYEEYKIRWNAGFQTKNIWPDTFSYKLEYKQRDDIGDARTNWELNRHFQFALLSKNYMVCGDAKYLKEFEVLFEDWNINNSFLHGISWTNVMEVAIRCSNWCYALAFLSYSGIEQKTLDKLRVGIINMTDYIVKHYSRYSSANNHLIVEAFAIGQSGILFDHKKWIDLSIELLTRELPLQNYSDGVNKELSLHYQSFYMEAMGLMMRLMVKNIINVPPSWKPMLEKMSQYVADCMGDYGEVVVFGDDDEGKILDLQGGKIDHYQYVLSMMSLLLNKRYIDLKIIPETLHWLFTDEEIEIVRKKEQYHSQQYCCYKEGGNTILRSTDRKVLIGIDHADLGFGSIAAHGHADALSFQLFYEGHPIFVDPGTYIYHCDIESRNIFRRTKNHNTVTIDNMDQSEMLGAFLWGKKAKCILDAVEEKDGKIIISSSVIDQKSCKHTRTIYFDGNREIEIKDTITPFHKSFSSFVLGENIEYRDGNLLFMDQKKAVIVKCSNPDIRLDTLDISDEYGKKKKSFVLRNYFETEENITLTLVGLV